MVVVLHVFVYLHVRNLIPEVPELVKVGRAGVDIFFVISGFIMVWINKDTISSIGASRDFLVKRIIRIAPIYWLYTLLMASLVISFPHLVSEGKTVTLEHLGASLLFLPYENNIGQIKPTLNVGWTLNFEMYFYIIFSVILLFKKRYLLLSLSAIMLTGIVFGEFIERDTAATFVVTSPLLLEFLMGCIIALLYKSTLHMPTWIWALLAVLGFFGLFANSIISFSGHYARVLNFGVPGALIVMGAVFLERNSALRVGPLFVSLGNSSYSLYLSHVFTVSAFGKIWSMLFGFGVLNEVFMVLAIITAIAVGHAGYVLVERPLTSKLNAGYRNWKESAPRRSKWHRRSF